MSELGLLSLPSIEVVIPKTVSEAVKLVEDGGYRILAGGTYTISSIIQGFNKDRRFVDISGLSELNFLHKLGERVEAGALVTQSQLIENLRSEIPAFESFWRNYSSPPACNRATLGGSIMLRKATEDLIPIMLVLDAVLTFQTSNGQVSQKLSDFIHQRTTKPMLLRSVSFEKSSGCYFDKLWLGVSRIPLISVAVNLVVNKRVELVKIAVSHQEGYLPNRVYSVEKYLEGRVLDETIINSAAQRLSQSINPQSDVLASAWYRREVAGVLLKRLLEKIAGDRCAGSD